MAFFFLLTKYKTFGSQRHTVMQSAWTYPMFNLSPPPRNIHRMCIDAKCLTHKVSKATLYCHRVFPVLKIARYQIVHYHDRLMLTWLQLKNPILPSHYQPAAWNKELTLPLCSLLNTADGLLHTSDLRMNLISPLRWGLWLKHEIQMIYQISVNLIFGYNIWGPSHSKMCWPFILIHVHLSDRYKNN